MTLRPHAPRSKSCPVCLKPFIPVRPMQAVCSTRCAHRKVRLDKTKEREAFRERRKALETIPELIKAAQKEFNAYIRARDQAAGYACISSGRLLDWSGNGVDAGHYRSVGAASHLRFDERNCHAQSKHDNQYRAGNAVDYRIGLIARIGREVVEALEADNTPHKWTADELRQIRETYKLKRKELEQE
jgi:hypothetical protein